MHSKKEKRWGSVGFSEKRSGGVRTRGAKEVACEHKSEKRGNKHEVSKVRA